MRYNYIVFINGLFIIYLFDKNKINIRCNNIIMIANKYNIDQDPIQQGAFGIVYKGFHIKTNEPVAIKIEVGDKKILKNEVKILNHLYSNGLRKIPSVYWFGEYNNYPCLVMPLYQCSLYDYMRTKTISAEKMNNIMYKIIEIIELIHSNFVVHRDIKPHNFMINNGDIFLIDFGLSTFYLNDSGQHYKNDLHHSIVGTSKFASYYIHVGNQYSRRDDLISLGYMYLFMVLGIAQWDNDINVVIYKDHVKYSNIHNVTDHVDASQTTIDISHPNNQSRMRNKELDFFIKNYCKYLDVSTNIEAYLKYVYELKYDECPKYDIYKSLFVTSSII